MISVLRRSSTAVLLKMLKTSRRWSGKSSALVCVSFRQNAGRVEAEAEVTAGGVWRRSFASCWRIQGNLCISSGALQACKSNEGYGFLRSRTTTRGGGCFGGNHKLLGWLALRFAARGGKGKKTRIIMYVCDYGSRILWFASAAVLVQESWSGCTAQSCSVTESPVGFHVTLWHSVASLRGFVWTFRCSYHKGQLDLKSQEVI